MRRRFSGASPNIYATGNFRLRNLIGADYEPDAALRAFSGVVPRAFFSFLPRPTFSQLRGSQLGKEKWWLAGGCLSVPS
jgi:hypothetical protein